MAKNDEILIRIRAESDKATKEIGRLEKELDKLSKTSSKAGKSSGQINKSFSSINSSANKLTGTIKGLAAAYLSIEGAKSLVRTSADIEQGFIGVAKTTGIAGKEMDDFKQKLFDMSTEMAGVSIEGLQSIAEAAGQLGISGTDNILEFTKVITKMAATTDLSAQDAAASMAQLGNSLGIPVKDYEKLGSVINELSNTTTASAGDLIAYSQRIAGMGKTFGLADTEILALSSTLKDVGISAELGGTAVNKMMMEMLKNTEGFAKVAGVELKEYSRIVKDEPIKAIELFLTALGKMDKASKIKTLDDLKLSSSGAAQTVLKLSGATDKLSKSLNTSSQAWKENTSLQKEYQTSSEGFWAQMDRVKNVIGELAAKITEALLPKLKEMIDQFVNWVKSLDDETVKRYAAQIANLAENFADVAAEVGKFAVSAASFIADNGKIIASVYLLIKGLNLAQGTMVTFGAKTVAMGAPAASFSGSMSAMTIALSSLWKGLNAVIIAAGPWGIAITAIIAATAGASKIADSYAENLREQANADMQSAKAMEQHTGSIEKIGGAYQKADKEIADHGNVTKKTHDQIEQALKDEIKAINDQLSAWEKNSDMTDMQEKNYFALAETVGMLKAKLDTLDADYTINMEMETRDADRAIESIKRKAQEPVESKLGFKPDTSAADRARHNIARPIRVPVTYVPTNSRPSSTSYSSASGLVASALSSLSLPSLPSISPLSASGVSASGNQSPAAATSAQAVVNINLNGNTYPMSAEESVAKRLAKELAFYGGM